MYDQIRTAGAANTDGSMKALKAENVSHDTELKSRTKGPELVEDTEEDFTKNQWFIGRLVQKAPLTLLVGPSEGGKTGLLIEMACCIGAGYPFLGCQVSQAPVILLAGEGSEKAYRNRVAAVKQRFRDDGRGEPMVAWVHDDFDLVRRTDHAIRTTKACAISLWERYGMWPQLLALDTIPSMTLGIEENTSDGMGSIIAGMKMVAREVRCSILGVTHPARGQGKKEPRGHSSLFNFCDASLFADGSALTGVKIRDCALNPISTLAGGSVLLAQHQCQAIPIHLYNG